MSVDHHTRAAAPESLTPTPADTTTGTRLDPWFGSYAERTHSMKQSEIRALFSVVNRPEVVSLAGGMPDLTPLPMADLGKMAAELVTVHGMSSLQYGPGQGSEVLRTQICDVMAEEAIEAHPDDIVITTGSQQALDLVTRVFVNPGDVIIAEAPSYVGALGVFRSYQADVIHAEMDEEGLIPEAFEAAIAQARARGKAPKFLYTVPNFHNPAGVTLSLARRLIILDIARRNGILVVEDNPYGLLGFGGDPLPALRSFDADGVVYLGTFSKTFAPGLRVGWALAPHAVREKLILANESAVLSPSNFTQMAVSHYLANHDWRAQIAAYRENYRVRRDVMLDALTKELSIASWTVPEGGFYVWVKLPDGLDASAMLPRAVTERVAYVSGSAFYMDGSGRSHMRLSYCYPPLDRITEGVRRLAGVVHSELETAEMFGNPAVQSTDDGLESPPPDAR